ncbi:MAG: VOC family protein, partial [Acidobacteria bacterium]|nr:VOC family protein [Acidobacteriota bacterium]
GELAGGAYLSAMMRVTPLRAASIVHLGCKGGGATLKLRLGERSGASSFQKLAPDQAFFSFDSSPWSSGCVLEASLDNGSEGRSDPYPMGRIVRVPRMERFELATPQQGAGEVTATITGQNLETIEKAGWTAEEGLPVQQLPLPVPGAAEKQTLEIRMAPPPGPSQQLYVWLRGEAKARATRVRVTPAAAPEAAGPAAELPLLGLSHVAVRVSDIENSREFYHDVLGFDEAFDFKAPDGTLAMAFFKVNDSQFIEIFPGIRPSDANRPYLAHIGFITADVEKAREMCERLGLQPGPVRLGARDHDRHFVILNPPGQKLALLEFMQYQPGSVYRENEGKALSARRISTRLEHAGIVTTDLPAAISFYEKLGFRETWSRKDGEGRPLLVHLRMPGASGDYIELAVRAPDAALSRAQMGSAGHFSLEVPDVKASFKLATDRGQNIKEPRFGMDERWQFNMFDPDGTRVECMQPKAAR